MLLLLFLKDDWSDEFPAAAPRRDGEEVEGEERCVYRLDGDGMVYLFLFDNMNMAMVEVV